MLSLSTIRPPISRPPMRKGDRLARPSALAADNTARPEPMSIKSRVSMLALPYDASICAVYDQ